MSTGGPELLWITRRLDVVGVAPAAELESDAGTGLPTRSALLERLEWALHPAGDGEVNQGGAAVLAFGSERHGLSAEVRARADRSCLTRPAPPTSAEGVRWATIAPNTHPLTSTGDPT